MTPEEILASMQQMMTQQKELILQEMKPIIEKTVAIKISELKENAPEEDTQGLEFDDGTPPTNIQKKEVYHIKKRSDMYQVSNIDESTMLYYEPFPDVNTIFNSYEDAHNYAISQGIKETDISEPGKIDKQYAIFTKSLYIAE